jgi:hypothetical protein
MSRFGTAQVAPVSQAFGEVARQYREWSQKNWQQVTDDRNASQDRKNCAVRETLGGGLDRRMAQDGTGGAIGR